MNRTLMTLTIGLAAVGFALAPGVANAHCDSVDGPVAKAAITALETKNVAVVLPYAPADAEAEMREAFTQAVAVRAKGDEAKALADRYFMETTVRLHRAGEKAPYTGLKPAGRDFGPAIPAAERAVETGQLDPVLKLLADATEHGITHRFHRVVETRSTKTAEANADVAAARARVSAELGFITYVHGLYEATKGAAHAE